ncbi:MAG: signal recognition particle protein [Verrucomicrobiota bacterium]
MANLLTDKLQEVFKNLRGYGKLSESNVEDAVREVRLALLAADVNYQVAKELCDEIKQKSLGEEVLKSIKPSEQFVKIFHDELISKFNEKQRPLSLDRPLRILLCGLNGAGKTTSAAKLAAFFKKNREDVVLVAGDLKRPAAIKQLQTLGEQIQVPVLAYPEETSVQRVAERAQEDAKRLFAKILIFDAAGRLDVDEELLTELHEVAQAWKPQETLLVADAATGQTAVKVAQAFQSKVSLTGVILSKYDADARGGAALSLLQVTGCPIQFLGIGEKPDALEFFMPQRVVDRLLGMGDIIGLVQKAQEEFDLDSGMRLQEKIKKNKFDLQDFIDQMRFIRKLGPLQNLLGMIPGMSHIDPSQIDEKRLKRVEAIVLSMTPLERKKPDVMNARRRQRIAKGSGNSVSDVNDLLRRFEEMKKMMQKMTQGNPEKLLKQMMSRR